VPTVPPPEPGLVVHFNYLWRREQAKGLEEARYPRPCAIVVSYKRSSDGALIVMLAPITHAEPPPGAAAMLIPTAVKRHLGLDEERSWVILDEVNETGWPGYDLQTNAEGQYAYGFIPPRLYERIKAEILAQHHAGRLKRVVR
jgi:hypothetical protein